MADRIIFNDASLPFPPNSDPSDHLKDFFAILKKANDAQVALDRATGAEVHWSALIYSEQFSFSKWLNTTLDSEERRQIKSVMTKVACPLNSEAKKVIEDRIFVLTEDDAITTDALGFASVRGASCISFRSHERWRKVILEITEMCSHEGRELTLSHGVNNISEVCHIDPFIDKIRIGREENVRFFTGLEEQGNKDFPNILFNKEVLKTLQRPIEVSQYQTQIINALNRLNHGIEVSNSLEELAKNTELDISGESGATMEVKKFARKRRFSHPIFETASFEAHVKNFPDAKRMHIFPDYSARKICIGYFGNHLPTKSDPT